MLPDGYCIRRATLADMPILCYQRRSMFEDMRLGDPATLDHMVSLWPGWAAPRMESGEYLSWIVENSGAAVAGASLWLIDWPPHLVGAGKPRGNILNVYTERDHRGRGLAKCLMETILAWCRTEGIQSVVLHASEMGRPLYESLGFESTNEMRLKL